MIASAHRAPVDADRSRRAADSPSRLSMGTFVLAATLCFLAILSSSHGKLILLPFSYSYVKYICVVLRSGISV